MNIQEIISKIIPANKEVAAQAQKKLDSLTKPPGSLGRLEECAIKYVAARGFIDAELKNPAVLTFAGDHGVAAEGVSAFPQEVTAQMVANFANGGAAINVLANFEGASLKVIDVGVVADCKFPGVIQRKVAKGTANFIHGPAMTLEQTKKALMAGIDEASKAISEGATIIATGDMGIANTTPSTALYAALLNLKPADITGRGTGIDDARLKHKTEIIEKAIEINRNQLTDTLGALAALGGFEIAAICGAILCAASNKIPVIVDGFISGSAAVMAIKLNKNTADYCFFSHLSADAGHNRVMEELHMKPLLDLDLRLGEGTGAVLALHLIKAGLAVMRGMATFEEAAVTKT